MKLQRFLRIVVVCASVWAVIPARMSAKVRSNGRVVNQAAEVRSAPGLKRGIRRRPPGNQYRARRGAGGKHDVVRSVTLGPVPEVLDSQPGWCRVVLAADGSGTRRVGWIRTQDVEIVSADDQTAAMRALSEKVAQLQRELDALRNAAGTGPTVTSQAAAEPAVVERAAVTPPAPPANDRLLKARAELELRQWEYDEAVKAARSGTAQSSVASSPSFRASDTSRFDVFGGYAALWDQTDSITFPLGWIASIGGHLNDSVAMVGEVGGNYKKASAFGVNAATASIHTFAGGPQFLGRAGTVTTFGQILGGVAVGSKSLFGYSLPSSTGLALLPGFGVDVPVAHNLGMRVGGEFGFVHSSFGWSNGFRLMTGLVVAGGTR